jgi:hypothetical protein
MRALTYQAEQTVNDLAQRYGVSTDAVTTLLHAVVSGGGTMAQFYHPELGGGGQWMQGGMTMVSDMFNHSLQAKVAGLCAELSNLTASQQVYAPLPPSPAGMMGMNQGNTFWPAELGQPSSTGGQNDFRYAYFPATRRLAVERAGQLSIYDTLDHQIGGVSQQQSGGSSSFTFSSQFGQFTVESLPLIQPAPAQQQYVQPYQPPPPPAPAPYVEQYQPPPQNMQANPPMQAPNTGRSSDRDEIFTTLDRLGDLRDRGILSDAEFAAKKTELLARL